MEDFVLADFLVVSAALRAIYQDIAAEQHVDGQELKGIAASLTSLSATLNQFVERDKQDTHLGSTSMVTKEPFEDVLALLWQLAWIMHQKGLPTKSLDELRRQLRELHKKLGIFGYGKEYR
jgi:hypothetical protein